MTIDTFKVFSFDDLQVEPRTGEVFKSGVPLQLEPKAFKLLVFLIENRDRLVEKEEILDVLWKDTYVTENALASAIAKLRRTLGDDSKTARYIQTVHTRGYRFIANVNVEVRSDSARDGHARAKVGEAGRQEDSPSFTSATAVPGSTQSQAGDAPVAGWPRFTKRIVLAGVLCLLLLGAAFAWRSFAGRKLPASPSASTSIAILPFDSPGASADDQVLGFEIADALTSRLSNIARLAVRPSPAVLHFSESNKDPATIGRALNVDYVLQGKIQRSPDLVTMQLIRVRDGASLQTAVFNEKFTNIFQVEESLSSRILQALTVTLDHEDKQKFRRRYTENAAAYDAFLKAHYFMNLATREGIDKGIVYFHRAIDEDPKYAMAYAGLADCYRRLLRFGVAPAEFIPKSRAAVTKALELDNTVAYAHSMLGYIAFQYDWDFSRAEREYKLARELDPALVHQWYAFYLLAVNRAPDAEIEFKKFNDFLPFMAPANATYGQYFYLMHRYDQAVDHLNKSLDTQANYPPARESLGMVYEQQGRTSEATTELQKAIDLSGGIYGLGSLGHLYATLGRRTDAQKILQSIAEQSKRTYVSPYEGALVYAGLDDKEAALRELEKAYAERSLAAPFLRFDPRLSNLRGEPRFQDFARRIGLSF